MHVKEIKDKADVFLSNEQLVTFDEQHPHLLLSAGEDQDESLHHMTAAQVHR